MPGGQKKGGYPQTGKGEGLVAESLAQTQRASNGESMLIFDICGNPLRVVDEKGQGCHGWEGEDTRLSGGQKEVDVRRSAGRCSDFAMRKR